MQLWFLPAMAVTVILFYGIKKVKPCFLKTCLVLTIPLIGYMCFLFDIPKLIWNIDSATMLLPFLAFGYHVKKNFGKIASFMEKSKNISLAGLFFVSIAIGGMAASYNPARAGIVGFDYNTYGSFALTMIPAFLLSSVCFFGSFLLYVRCIDTVPIIRWTFRLIEWFGRNSLIVFGFDLFVNFVALKITETILIPRISVIFIKLLIDALIIETWTICKRHLTEVNAIWFAC